MTVTIKQKEASKEFEGLFPSVMLVRMTNSMATKVKTVSRDRGQTASEYVRQALGRALDAEKA